MNEEKPTRENRKKEVSEDRPFQLAIKLHQGDPRRSATKCGLCGGKITKKQRGPRLCELHTGELVCDACGLKQAPSLVALLDLLDVARRYSIVEASYRKITQSGTTRPSAKKKFNLEIKPFTESEDKAFDRVIGRLLGRDVVRNDTNND